MKIAKIKDNDYIQNYYYVDGQILSLRYMKAVFEEKEVKKILRKAKRSKEMVIPKINFPTREKMVKDIVHETANIINTIKGYENLNEDEKHIAAGTVLNNIANGFTYDQTTQANYYESQFKLREFSSREEIADEVLNKKVDEMLDAIGKQSAKVQFAAKLKDFRSSEQNYYKFTKRDNCFEQEVYERLKLQKINFVEKTLKEHAPEKAEGLMAAYETGLYFKYNFFEKRVDQFFKGEDIHAIKTIYLALVLKRGVCEHLAYGISHVLNELNLENFLVSAKMDDGIHHMFNAIVHKEKDAMYLSDATVTMGAMEYALEEGDEAMAKIDTRGLAPSISDYEKLMGKFKIRSFHQLQSLKGKRLLKIFHDEDPKHIEEFVSRIIKEPNFTAYRTAGRYLIDNNFDISPAKLELNT